MIMETSSSPAVSSMEKETIDEQKQATTSSETKEVVVEVVHSEEENMSTKETVKMEMVNLPIQDGGKKDALKDGEEQLGEANMDGAEEAALKNQKEEPDAKKEETKKSETPDVLCLQLDEGDNLDVYLEKERARKKELLENKMKAKAEIEKIEAKKPQMVRKVKTVKRLKPLPKKKVAKIVQKKVKSKIVESTKKIIKDEHNQLNEEDADNKEQLKDVKDKDNNKEIDKVDNNQEIKEQPEVAVKSVVVKCEKERDSRFLWVSNINRCTKANDLKAYFTPHGKVQTARVVTDGRNYYGYVVMEKKEDVENCIKNLEGAIFEGNKIHLSEKRPERRKSRSEERKEKGCSRDRSRESSRHSSKSNDPLTLKVRDHRSEEITKKYERAQMLHERSQERREMIRRKREAERIREERRKERIKYEERKAQEIKIEREKRRLEHERHLIEKEKMNLLRLQKKLADTERSLIQRQKQELERDIKNLEYKKRKSAETFERKTKSQRIEERPKEYWKDRSSPKTYEESYKKDNVLVPPPPVLTENYHQKTEKDRVWESKKEYSSERKEQETRYSYTDRSDYQDRYQKDRYKDKEKSYTWQGFSTGNTESWRQEPTRNVARHTISFPVTGNPYEVQTTPGYYQGAGYRKTNEYYYRGPERKY